MNTTALEAQEKEIKRLERLNSNLTAAGESLAVIAENLLTWCIEEDKKFLYGEKIEKHKRSISIANATKGE